MLHLYLENIFFHGLLTENFNSSNSPNSESLVGVRIVLLKPKLCLNACTPALLYAIYGLHIFAVEVVDVPLNFYPMAVKKSVYPKSAK